MKVCALASGSSGNCFYISDDKNENAIIIDAGISSKQIVEKLGIINSRPENIKAILITHEHSDHIKGVDVFARSFNIPIYANEKTIKSRFLCSNNELINSITNNETLSLGKFEIESFQKSHKAADPIGFTIINKKRVSVITDAGFVCSNIKSQIKDADFLFLEANHDIEMLEKGFYPWHLKKWIKSDIGHLSNNQASLAVLEHSNKKLKNIVLSHISQNNNTPKLAANSFKILKERRDLKPNISVSQREFPTELFKV